MALLLALGCGVGAGAVVVGVLAFRMGGKGGVGKGEGIEERVGRHGPAQPGVGGAWEEAQQPLLLRGGAEGGDDAGAGADAGKR